MPTPESENRQGQDDQAPPDGVLWYERADGMSGARFTRRIAFFDRRGLPPSLESFMTGRTPLENSGSNAPFVGT